MLSPVGGLLLLAVLLSTALEGRPIGHICHEGPLIDPSPSPFQWSHPLDATDAQRKCGADADCTVVLGTCQVCSLFKICSIAVNRKSAAPLAGELAKNGEFAIIAPDQVTAEAAQHRHPSCLEGRCGITDRKAPHFHECLDRKGDWKYSSAFEGCYQPAPDGLKSCTDAADCSTGYCVVYTAVCKGTPIAFPKGGGYEACETLRGRCWERRSVPRGCYGFLVKGKFTSTCHD